MTTASDLMASFAERTGVVGEAPPRRYLWTDAFAVCNLLGLGKPELAQRLVDSVHQVLGRRRETWISGLTGVEAETHPTIGGLRIGKPLPERAPDEPLDHEREWDRDGQYFHYLTKWMHALDRLARATGGSQLAMWSRELAATAHLKFVYRTPRGLRMHWKMSVDLSRPQVASMGHHDPLDGYVTALALEATARKMSLGGPSLEGAIADYRSMIEPGALATDDALGIGGLLFDAHRLARLDADHRLRDALVGAARAGLDAYTARPDLRLPASHRLAFRELGLAIGLAAVDAKQLERYAPLRRAITSFWLEPQNRRTRTYRDHEDINDVMLATALEPEGLLG